jgi:hypothetical protein
MYAITRSSHSNAWKVQLTRGGVLLCKTFSFSTHGGEAAALARAQLWRDEVVRTHPPITRRHRANILRRNSKSGIPGVTFTAGLMGSLSVGTPRPTSVPATSSPKPSACGVGGLWPSSWLSPSARGSCVKWLDGLECTPARRWCGARLRGRCRPMAPIQLTGLTLSGATTRAASRACISAGPTQAILGSGEPGRMWAVASTLPSIFPVKQYGEEKAKALVISERRRQLEHLARLAPGNAHPDDYACIPLTRSAREGGSGQACGAVT